LNLGAGIFIHPKIVAYRQRAVAHGIQPVAFPTRLKRDGAFNITEAPGASWRILVALLILRLIGGVILVLRESTWGVLGEQQNRRRKHCKGKSCAFSH
jgi:hypothetical protein